MDKKIESKIVSFNSVHQKEPKDKSPIYCIGTIFLDLTLPYDGTNLYLRLLYKLEDGITNDMFDSFNELLKNFFLDALNQVSEL